MFQQYKPKCVNCGAIGGTLFSCKNDEEEHSRKVIAICGNKLNPCPLNINITLGNYQSYPVTINNYENDIKEYKNKIINDKNKLLFGYITTESALENFEDFKQSISDTTSLLSYIYEEYNEKIDNKEKNDNLKRIQEESYIKINNIKEAISNFDKTADPQYAQDAVSIYVDELTPKLKQILELKYNNNFVEYNDVTNTFHLIQQKVSLRDLEYILIDPKVNRFDVGMVRSEREKKGKKGTDKKKLLIIESSDEGANEGDFTEQIEPETKPESEVEDGQPDYNSDGTITWNNSDYQRTWDKLKQTYKDALLKDHEWLEESLAAYVKYEKDKKINPNLRKQFVSPTNLIIPPQLQDDKYDFGNEVYNDIFNKMSKAQRDTFLGMIKKDSTDQRFFLDNLGLAIAQEVGYSKF